MLLPGEGLYGLRVLTAVVSFASWRWRGAVSALPVAHPAEERQHDEPVESPQGEPPGAVPAAHCGGGRRGAAADAG